MVVIVCRLFVAVSCLLIVWISHEKLSNSRENGFKNKILDLANDTLFFIPRATRYLYLNDTWWSSSKKNVAIVPLVHKCVLCVVFTSLHIKPFFLPNDISTLSVRADSSS